MLPYPNVYFSLLQIYPTILLVTERLYPGPAVETTALWRAAVSDSFTKLGTPRSPLGAQIEQLPPNVWDWLTNKCTFTFEWTLNVWLYINSLRCEISRIKSFQKYFNLWYILNRLQAFFFPKKCTFLRSLLLLYTVNKKSMGGHGVILWNNSLLYHMKELCTLYEKTFCTFTFTNFDLHALIFLPTTITSQLMRVSKQPGQLQTFHTYHRDP